MRVTLALLLVAVASVNTSASNGKPVDIGAEAKGANRVVVAVVTDVQSRFDVNEFGDRLIISQAWARVDETMKGSYAPIVAVDVEGGTIGDLALHVSDMPELRPGDRAVFFLDATPSGTHKPHGRGAGVFKLDANDRVPDSDLTLGEIRAQVRAALR